MFFFATSRSTYQLFPRVFSFLPSMDRYNIRHFILQPIIKGGVNYRDQPWHKECFLCIGCKEQLAGQRFTSRDDFTYCLNCFCNLFAKKCASCSNPISGNSNLHFCLKFPLKVCSSRCLFVCFFNQLQQHRSQKV